MSFSKYAALVKNLRGVVLFNLEEEGVEESIKWLVKRFKYRNLGVAPHLVAKYSDRLRPYLSGNPFRELTSPVRDVDDLVELLAKTVNTPYEVVESLVYASVYVSPLLLIGEHYSRELESLSTGTVYTCKELSVRDWKLHLRIADYTVLDFYEGCVDEVLKTIDSGKAGGLEKIVESRQKRIETDKRRYWRVRCEHGRPFLHYVDLLGVALKHGIRELKPEYSAGLAVVPVVRIQSGLKDVRVKVESSER